MKVQERVQSDEKPKSGVYTFPGLQGVPQYLHQPDLPQHHKPMHKAGNQVFRAKHSQRSHGSQKHEESASARAGGLARSFLNHESNPGMLSLRVLTMASHAENARTVYHDLVTPHRSYVFPGRWQTQSSVRLEQAKKTRESISVNTVSDARLAEKEQKQKELRRRQVTNRSKSVAAACRPHIARTASTFSERQERLDEVKLHHLLKGHAWNHNNELPNELVGAFQNPDLYGKPKVKTFSTFEEYLERTVNAHRDIPIQFHPSQVQTAQKSFRSRKTRQGGVRSKSTEPNETMNFDDIAKQLALKGERAATSMGFAPSREVVEMHRNRPPWLIDPAIFVRAYTDTQGGKDGLGDVMQTRPSEGQTDLGLSQDSPAPTDMSGPPSRDVLFGLDLDKSITSQDLQQ